MKKNNRRKLIVDTLDALVKAEAGKKPLVTAVKWDFDLRQPSLRQRIVALLDRMYRADPQTTMDLLDAPMHVNRDMLLTGLFRNDDVVRSGKVIHGVLFLLNKVADIADGVSGERIVKSQVPGYGYKIARKSAEDPLYILYQRQPPHRRRPTKRGRK